MKAGISNVEQFLNEAIQKVSQYVRTHSNASAFFVFEHYLNSGEFSNSNLKYQKMIKGSLPKLREKLLLYPRSNTGKLFGHVRVRKNTEVFYFDINFCIEDNQLFFINFTTAEQLLTRTLPEDLFETVFIFICDPDVLSPKKKANLTFVPYFNQNQLKNNQQTPTTPSAQDEENESYLFPELLAVLNTSMQKFTPKRK